MHTQFKTQFQVSTYLRQTLSVGGHNFSEVACFLYIKHCHPILEPKAEITLFIAGITHVFEGITHVFALISPVIAGITHYSRNYSC